MDGFPNIPSEIISEIFALCLPETKYSLPDPRLAPLLLTHVCSSWRDFVSATSPLWKTLKLSTWETSNLQASQAIKQLVIFTSQVTLWNRNLRGHPLDIMLKLISPYDDNENLIAPTSAELDDSDNEGYNLRTFWNPLILLAVKNNLRKLYLHFDDVDQGSGLYHLPSSCFSILESLHFQTAAHPRQYNRQITVFSQVHTLRKVILDAYPTVTKLIDLPWHQLTHIIINREHSSTLFHSIITACKRLEVLIMKIFNSSVTLSSPITMHSLRKLHLTMSTAAATTSFFVDIQLPALEEFGIYSYTGHMPQTFTWLPNTPSHSLLFHQLGLLRTLKLGFQDIPSSMLLDLLRFTPFLVELGVDSELGSYIAFLDGLTYHANAECNLIPRLQNFSLYVEILNQTQDFTTFPFSSSQFLAMITSRAKPNTPSSQDPPQHEIYFPLKRVFLCVEAATHNHALDMDALELEVQARPDLSDIDFKFQISESKMDWMQESVETW